MKACFLLTVVMLDYFWLTGTLFQLKGMKKHVMISTGLFCTFSVPLILNAWKTFSQLRRKFQNLRHFGQDRMSSWKIACVLQLCLKYSSFNFQIKSWVDSRFLIKFHACHEASEATGKNDSSPKPNSILWGKRRLSLLDLTVVGLNQSCLGADSLTVIWQWWWRWGDKQEPKMLGGQKWSQIMDFCR